MIINYELPELDWKYRADDGVWFAEPNGFLHSYYIYPPNIPEGDYYDKHLDLSPKFTLELIEHSGHYDEKKTTNWTTLDQAQKTAFRHYMNVVCPNPAVNRV